MKSIYSSFITWLGGVLVGICITSQTIWSESPFLGCVMLFTGMCNLALGLFLNFKNGKLTTLL